MVEHLNTGTYQVMLDANGGKIEWRFIEQFHNLKEKEV
jgi:hypothetical protein